MNRSTPAAEQLSLFDAVVATYAERERASNEALYQEVAARAGIPDAALACRQRIGKHRYNPTKRKIRWVQQTLKHIGLLERAGPGVWTLSAEGHRKLKLKRINAGHVMLAFSTDLGVALWANCASAFARLGEPIHLALTSPPYPLAKPRAYGNPSEGEFVDFICRALEPIIKRLVPGGSLVLNVTNDVFERGLPSRSLYRERMVIALHERFGLHKMDEIPWENLSKPSGPVQWASKARNQLNTGWEPVYWFTNDPLRVRADNRRVLLPHTERHLKFLQSGGVKRDREYADGAHRQRAGKPYSNITAGRIPRNVLQLGHICALQNAYKRDALPGRPCGARTRSAAGAMRTGSRSTFLDPLSTSVLSETVSRWWGGPVGTFDALRRALEEGVSLLLPAVLREFTREEIGSLRDFFVELSMCSRIMLGVSRRVRRV